MAMEPMKLRKPSGFCFKEEPISMLWIVTGGVRFPLLLLIKMSG
jgi:hypothetical protein